MDLRPTEHEGDRSLRNRSFSEAQILGMLREFDAETPPKNSHVAKAVTQT